MCGISGVVNKLGLLEPQHCEAVIDRMNEHLKHRGPDRLGAWHSPEDKVSLGHTRLSIMDLSDVASQPMQDVTGQYVLSYNGELYNYSSIREYLEKNHGVVFKTTGDTEVFLYGLIHIGVEKFLSMADGMFAAAYLDTATKKLILIRDRAGEKPLYFFDDPSIFAFSSELKPLIEIKDSPSIDSASLYFYLLLRYVPAPYSLIKGIYKLEAGQYLSFCLESHQKEVISYFSWDPDPDLLDASRLSAEKAADVVEALLSESIQSVMSSDVPIGFFLSGGIDSSICAALARKKTQDNINSYTIQFENDPNSEHEISETTAKLLGLRHKKRLISVSEIKERSEVMIQAMDEPNGDRSCVPTFLLSEFAKSDVI